MNPTLQITTILFLLLLSCTNVTESPGPGGTQTGINPNSDWLVPENEVLDGGVGKDGIPSIDNPRFSIASEITFLNDDDLVLGIVIGDEVKAYPHPILDWHEIVNDEIGGNPIALTYCPLTGTGVGWDRTINGDVTTFGVSGLLYNTNLMPYDRASNSTWSQQRLQCVNGANKGKDAVIYSFVETSWSTWKASFPESSVLNTKTGISRNYSRYPYGDYRTNNRNILFPISNNDDRLPAKERVLGVRVKGFFEAYPFNNDVPGVELIEDVIEAKELLVIRSKEYNFIIAFLNPNDGRKFSAASKEEFPIVLRDDHGGGYNILGQNIANTGSKLELPDQFIGYWFSWGAFYPNITIF